MTRRKLARQRRNKKLAKQANFIPPLPPAVSEVSIQFLQQAYPISIYWDADDTCYVAELNAFGDSQVHATTWEQAAAAAKIAHRLLIESYQAGGYTLPEV